MTAQDGFVKWFPAIFAGVVIWVVSNFAPKVAFWILLLTCLVLVLNVKDYFIYTLKGGKA